MRLATPEHLKYLGCQLAYWSEETKKDASLSLLVCHCRERLDMYGATGVDINQRCLVRTGDEWVRGMMLGKNAKKPGEYNVVPLLSSGRPHDLFLYSATAANILPFPQMAYQDWIRFDLTSYFWSLQAYRMTHSNKPKSVYSSEYEELLP